MKKSTKIFNNIYIMTLFDLINNLDFKIIENNLQDKSNINTKLV